MLPISPHPRQRLFSDFFNLAILVGMKEYLIIVSLVDVVAPSHVYLGHLCIFFGEVSIRVLCLFEDINTGHSVVELKFSSPYSLSFLSNAFFLLFWSLTFVVWKPHPPLSSGLSSGWLRLHQEGPSVSSSPKAICPFLLSSRCGLCSRPGPRARLLRDSSAGTPPLRFLRL